MASLTSSTSPVPHGDPRSGTRVRGQEGGAEATAARLNGYDVVVVQHEYGIFGGPDGQDVLDVVRAVTRPVIVVLHTVLVTPSLRQKAILDELVMLSDAVVTMTLTAKDRLVRNYSSRAARFRSSPRCRRHQNGGPAAAGRDQNAAPIVLTWGLLGEGKGIEWGISAMAQLRDIHPAPRYHVVGETHPKVLERDGEVYRRGLEARARDLGVDDAVTFDARYLETSKLSRLVQEADVILLPYDSREQVTSGVLVEAVTAGKPVISTGFPHAVELLSSGAGLLVERQNPDAIAAALRRVLTEPAWRTTWPPRPIDSAHSCCGAPWRSSTATWRPRPSATTSSGSVHDRFRGRLHPPPTASVTRPVSSSTPSSPSDDWSTGTASTTWRAGWWSPPASPSRTRPRPCWRRPTSASSRAPRPTAVSATVSAPT